MSKLADAVIQQKNRMNDPTQAPDGCYTDDMGYWVEESLPQDKARYAEYLLLRILRRHPCFYLRYGELWLKHRRIEATQEAIIRLVDSPLAKVNTAQAVWIHNRLKEHALEIDENKIMLAPTLYWDVDKAELVDTYDTITTIKDVHA